MRVLPYVCALLLGAGAALFAGCGDQDNLIPSGDARALSTDLAAVRAAADERECGTSDSAIRRARSTVTNLPESVDDRLRQRLLSGLQRLQARADTECAAAPETTTTTVPTTTAPEVVPETTTTEEAPTTTTTTPTEPTVPTDPTTDPTDPGGGVTPDPGTTTPPDDGGAAPTDPTLPEGDEG